MDVNPFILEAHATISQHKLLDYRAADAPFGSHLSNLPVVGGIIVPAPLKSPPPDLGRFKRVLQTVANHEKATLTILVLGGSMTSGRMNNKLNKNESNCFIDRAAFGLDKDEPTIYEWACYGNSVGDRDSNRNTENFDCKPCAWPARFETWLRSSYPHVNVNVINLARGGMGTNACLGLLGGLLKKKKLADLIDVAILNFVHNDGEEVSMKKSRARKELARIPNMDDKERKKKTEEAFAAAEAELRRNHEALLRELLSLPNKPAVLTMQLAGGTLTPEGMFPLHADSVHYYQVPAISWYNTAQKAGVPANVSALGHPTWAMHQLVADWLAYVWTRLDEHATASNSMIAAATEHVPSSAKVSDVITPDLPRPKWMTEDSEFCVAPLTFLDARTTSGGGNVATGSTSQSTSSEEPSKKSHARALLGLPNLEAPRVTRQSRRLSTAIPAALTVKGNWSFGEDFPHNGKTAWWINEAEGGTIVFPVAVALGSHNIGGIGYLSSWSPVMGVAKISIVGDPPGWNTIVNGSNGGEGIHISVSKYHRLCVSDKSVLEWSAQNGGNGSGGPIKTEKRRAAVTSSSMPILPACNHSLQMPFASRTTTPVVTEAKLQIELLPRRSSKESQSHHNKFVVRYIATC
jgi:hypothetical protein